MEDKITRNLKFKRWALRIVLGKQIVYVVTSALYKSQKEAEMIGNRIRADFLRKILLLFDTERDG